MFSNATLAPTIDCHQCVFPTPNFEVTDRVIVICSLPSPAAFDLYKSLEGQQKKRQTQQVNNYYVHIGQTARYLYLGKRWEFPTGMVNVNVVHILEHTLHIDWGQSRAPLICCDC